MSYWRVTKDSIKEFFDNEPLLYGSSIAFHLIFSLPAILIILVTIAGSAFEDQVVRDTLLSQLRQLYGPDSTEIIRKIIDNNQSIGSTWYAKAISIFTLLFSATAIFASLQNALNALWNIKSKPEKDFLYFWKNRLLSLGMVVSIGFLLLISLVIDTGLAIFKDAINQVLSDAGFVVVTGLNIALSVALVTLVFALIYKILPDAKIKWRNVWVGSFVTTLLFTAGKYLIGFYLGQSSFGNVYGAAGSLVLLLIWVFYSAVVVLYGASFTYVYSKEIGDEIEPADNAVFIKKVEVDNQIVNV